MFPVPGGGLIVLSEPKSVGAGFADAEALADADALATTDVDAVSAGGALAAMIGAEVEADALGTSRADAGPSDASFLHARSDVPSTAAIVASHASRLRISLSELEW
jgi:hypothetical protein